MITCFDTQIESLSIHYIGNKSKNELCTFSEEPLFLLDENLPPLMLEYFIKPFEKMQESFAFSHPSAIELNEVFHFAKITIYNKVYSKIVAIKKSETVVCF